jgi:Protein of unknown function (DUF3703)
MSPFGRALRPHVEAEIRAAIGAEARGESSAAFGHLERAHVLGQASTVEHVRVHWRMFLWGLRHRSARECLGQVLRIAGAAALTPIGLVPYGNTGGSNVSPFKRMPVPPELEAIIQRAHASAR